MNLENLVQRLGKGRGRCTQSLQVLVDRFDRREVSRRGLSLSHEAAEPLYFSLILANVPQHGLNMREQIEPVHLQELVIARSERMPTSAVAFGH